MLRLTDNFCASARSGRFLQAGGRQEDERDADTAAAAGQMTLERRPDPFRKFITEIEDLLNGALDDQIVRAYQLVRTALQEDKFEGNPFQESRLTRLFENIENRIAQTPALRNILECAGEYDPATPESASGPAPLQAAPKPAPGQEAAGPAGFAMRSAA